MLCWCFSSSCQISRWAIILYVATRLLSSSSTSSLLMLLLVSIAVLRMLMRPVVTDGVAWSVCWSVSLSVTIVVLMWESKTDLVLLFVYSQLTERVLVMCAPVCCMLLCKYFVVLMMLDDEDIIHRWQWRNFFTPCSCHLFFCHDVGASSDKCLLLWHHFLSKVMII